MWYNNKMLAARKKLAILRVRLQKRLAAHPSPKFEAVEAQPLLTPWHLFWARLGFVRASKSADLSLFAAGSFVLLAGFAIVAGLSSGVSDTKRILGETVVGMEFLRGQDLAAARVKFSAIETEIRSSDVGAIAGRIPEVSAHLIAAFEILQAEEAEPSALDLRWDSAANASDPSFAAKLRQSRGRWEQAAGEIREAENLAGNLPINLLPAKLGDEVASGLGLLRAARVSLEKASELSGMLLTLLDGEPKNYLLIFQNNNEARATGGFIGTYGLVELGRGRIKINKIESIYEPDGQLRERIAAPGPLRRQVTELWAMRDSNWFADFPSSSRKALEFLEKETGVLADGVISLTPDVFESWLRITGPVAMPEYGVVLSAQNFRETAQSKTSVDYDRILNQPKKFLADFAPRALSSLGSLDKAQRIALLESLSAVAEQKQLLMFSLDPAIEKTIRDAGIGGEIRKTPGDYLAIIHSNVGGGKTDQGMEQSVEKRVTIDELGRQVSHLRITRTNNATNELYFPKNVDFMRILVPEGAKISSASGFDPEELLPSTMPGVAADPDLIFWDSEIKRDWRTGVFVGREAGYTVFMGWLSLNPGETKTVELVYELPQQGPEYTLLLQKQAGSREFKFTLDVQMPSEIIYQYPSFAEAETVDQDRFYAVLGR